MKKAFELGSSPAQDIRAYSISGKYQSNDTDKEVYGGMLCVKKGQAPSSIYKGEKNDEAYIMENAVDSSTEVYVCNPDIAAFAVNEVQKTQYRQGSGTLGIAVPKGMFTRFTLLTVGATCKFGDGNFTTAPDTTNIYAVIGTGANAGLLVPQSSKPASGFGFKIESTENFTEGVYDGGVGYRCSVISL